MTKVCARSGCEAVFMMNRSIGGHNRKYCSERCSARVHWEANKEKIRAENRAAYYANRETRKAAVREYRNRNLDAVKSRQADRRKKHPHKNYAYLLITKYGLSYDRYLAISDSQGGKCAICHHVPNGTGPAGRLNVDHCHSTGRVRGLICIRCNRAIGLMKDSADAIEAMAKYLRSEVDHRG